MALVPCWIVKPCSPADRQNCEAYTTNVAPCWDVVNKGLICRDQECRLCSVYRFINECQDIKSFYRDLIVAIDSGDGNSIVEAAREKQGKNK